MANNIEAISLRFHAYRRATVEEARELIVMTILKLVDKVNANEKIRPYLKEYPFTRRGADISIAFHNNESASSYYLDGSVALVCQTHEGKLWYDSAELQKRKLPNFIDYDGKVEVGKIIDREVLVDLMQESYEEALKIVQGGKS